MIWGAIGGFATGNHRGGATGRLGHHLSHRWLTSEAGGCEVRGEVNEEERRSEEGIEEEFGGGGG
jgi:hypothetical protein